MPRFFVRQNRISDGNISIIGDDAHHIARSLRMAIGEQLTVCDMQGNEYQCEISCFNEDKEVIAKVLSQKHSENEPKVFITLFQALPKGDKLDTVIQKAVECGVSRIVPFQSERCVVKIKSEAEQKRARDAEGYQKKRLSNAEEALYLKSPIRCRLRRRCIKL